MNLQLLSSLAFSLTAIALLFAGMWLLIRVSHWGERHPLRPYLLQILGLTFILPVVLVAAVAGKLNDQALSALLGGMVAFVFGGRGAAQASEPNGQHASPTPNPPDAAKSSSSPDKPA